MNAIIILLILMTRYYKKLSLQKVVKLVAWTHNTNVSFLGYEPMRLVTGKSVAVPVVNTGNDATDSFFDSDVVDKIMEIHQDLMKRFSEVEYKDISV